MTEHRFDSVSIYRDCSCGWRAPLGSWGNIEDLRGLWAEHTAPAKEDFDVKALVEAARALVNAPDPDETVEDLQDGSFLERSEQIEANLRRQIMFYDRRQQHAADGCKFHESA